MNLWQTEDVKIKLNCGVSTGFTMEVVLKQNHVEHLCKPVSFHKILRPALSPAQQLEPVLLISSSCVCLCFANRGFGLAAEVPEA